MKDRKFDLTKLYVAIALQEKSEAFGISFEEISNLDMYPSIIEKILEDISSQQRIFQTLHSFPKEISAILLQERKNEILRVVHRFFEENKVLLKMIFSSCSERYSE